MERNEVARVTAIDALVGFGLTRDRAALIMYRVADNQPDFWNKALEDCASGGIEHVYLFVRMFARYDPAAMSVFLYAGSNPAALAYLMADLQDNTVGRWEGEEAEQPATEQAAPEPWRTGCFDIGPDLRRALSEAEI
jgi:hypothetical protein